MSVFPWQAGPRHLAHHCGLIQWLTHSRCLVNTSRWKNAAYLFIAGPSAGGLPCSPGCLGCSEWVGRGVAWGGRAALQGQTSYLEPHLPSPASHWSVLHEGVDLSHFLPRQPTPTPSQAGDWHPPCWHSGALAAALSARRVGRICFFPLPFFMLPSSLPRGSPGLVSRDRRFVPWPQCGQEGAQAVILLQGQLRLGMCCCHECLFSFYEPERASRGGAPAWFCPSLLPLTQSQFQTSPGHGPKGAAQTRAWQTSQESFKKTSVYLISFQNKLGKA